VERPALEVADTFRDFGPGWLKANRGHVSHAQLKVMSAIEACRTAALGGYVARCENTECAHTVIAYCSCRNRHCPKCHGSQALAWMAERKAELLQVPYFHVVFTLPAEIAAIAYQNKAVIYDLLFKAASNTMLTIATDPKHLGAKIGITAVLHTWGSAMTHHPHVHMIVTGGGISPDGSHWIASRPDYLVPVEVLSALFRGRMLGMLIDAHAAGRLQFFGDYQHLADRRAFKAHLAPHWETDWFVYAKRPFAGPEQVLAYLSRYTHRVAISNSRLIAAFERRPGGRRACGELCDRGRHPKPVTLPDLSACSKFVSRGRYSITSSARASKSGGTVRFSAFAVLRLITNSNLVGCTTGRSAGFSPLRMRPV
jgi:hypothetical protein